MSTGVGFWLDEIETFTPSQLIKFEKIVHREYMAKALKALTINDFKKLMKGIRKLENRRRREEQQ
jgi:hypothetical protein